MIRCMGEKIMKKKVLVSAVALLTSFLAVGCSNSGASKDAGSSTNKVHQTSKKNTQKSSNQDSASTSSSVEDNDSSSASSTSSNDESSKSSSTSDTSSSEKSSSQSSSKSNAENSSSSTQASSSSKSNASSQSSSSQTTTSGDISESDFQTVVNDTIKRNKYPSGTTVKDFSVMQSGNQIDVAEKKTGTIVAHYTVKNGHLYYYDVVTDQQEQVK